jgi:DNA repair exonuclease SbcCD ATPase subunit
MILRSIEIAGFGQLCARRFDFGPGLTIVYGPNESGKSTLANAIVATLYGAERKKEAWRPWSGGPFGATLVYTLANGEQIEVQRDFDRDAKGLRIYDRAGNELSAKLSGQKVVPGEAHVGIPHDVFVNAACVRQQTIAIDEGKPAAPIAAHLARALDGGPREDAALGALGRLDDALKIHVGTERARKNAPLRAMRALAENQRAAVDDARAQLTALETLSDRLERAGHERDRLLAAFAHAERRERALRAGAIAKRLAKLHEFRAELAELQADHAAYADVATFPIEREPEIDETFHGWERAQLAAAEASAEERAAVLGDADELELERRRHDVGAIDDATFEQLRAADDRATAARANASAAAQAEAARRDEPRRSGGGGILAACIVAWCIAIGCAIAHRWTWTGVAMVLALAGVAAALARFRAHAELRQKTDERRRIVDAALAADVAAAAAVRAILEPLGVDSYAEFQNRRSRYEDLLARKLAADRIADRARRAAFTAREAAARFDRLADALVPHSVGDRSERRRAMHGRAARWRLRAGIEAHLHALDMRRSTILGSDDEFALETERRELQRDGVAPADDESPGALRLAESERRSIDERLRVAQDGFERLRGEIDGARARVPDLAALDEQLARTQLEIERLEGFERAVTLARTTLERRTREAHQAFARRLEDYAAQTLGTITAGRYREIFVDPATLAIRVRIPETRAIADLDVLSAGTRDQAYLVVRFAMARMFAEGIETPPLLLDDPFAYWDGARIERCLPIIEYAARDAQAILFTASPQLATAAVRRGANRIDMPEPRLAIEPV